MPSPPPLKLNWPLDTIFDSVKSIYPKCKVEALHTVDSTNTYLLECLRQGQTAPRILVAEEQTAGRARMGKKWDTPVKKQLGSALTFSLALPMSRIDLGPVALVVACATIQALHKRQDPPHFSDTSRIKIKWPNDLWIMLNDCRGVEKWHKLAGILIEAVSIQQQRYLVVGIGINISPHLNHQSFTIPAGSLQQLSSSWSAQNAFAAVAPKVMQAVYNFNIHGFSPWETFFNQHDLLNQHTLYTSSGVQGVGAGINEQGHLLIQTEKGLQTIHSGEVSIRPC